MSCLCIESIVLYQYLWKPHDIPCDAVSDVHSTPLTCNRDWNMPIIIKWKHIFSKVKWNIWNLQIRNEQLCISKRNFVSHFTKLQYAVEVIFIWFCSPLLIFSCLNFDIAFCATFFIWTHFKSSTPVKHLTS